MSAVTKRLMVMIGVLGTLSLPIAILFAEPPTSVPPATPPSFPSIVDLPVVPAQADRTSEAIQSKIRSVLHGKGDGQKTGDPVLDDVLGVLRERGSILKGSSLDNIDHLETPNPSLSEETPSKTHDFRAAELLLRAARGLEKTGELSEVQKKLVRQMRIESVRLIQDANQ